MSWHATSASVLLSAVGLGTALAAESRFEQTHSRSQYVHWIDLYDARGRRIDPTDPNAAPYSPLKTCGKCHDSQLIAHGYHFNPIDKQVDAGRPGEPWIWTDTRTGTQIPLSYRGWSGTYDPDQLGISAWDFVLQFGRHLPGGGPGELDRAPADEVSAASSSDESVGDEQKPGDATARWRLSGPLNVDCMICHGNDRAYSPEGRSKQISSENFAWAPTVALGLGHVRGRVARLPDDFDPSAVNPDSGMQLPRTTYTPHRMNAEQKVFFDVVAKPLDNACYYCHTTRLVGQGAAPGWTHDEDVHLRAGMSCTDCHRNGIEHHTVRGFEGEEHPTGEPVTAWSCRGCHIQAAGGGRLGAPKPLHKGLPPLHLEKLACTTCHSGPRTSQQAFQVQTAMGHGLGLPSHYTAEDPPGVVAPVLMQDGGTLYPYRMMWPAFWGTITDDQITPLDPDDAHDALRRTLRVRRGATFTGTVSRARLTSDERANVLGKERARRSESELTEQEKDELAELERAKALEAWPEKLATALVALKEVVPEEGAEPVYVSGGKAYRLAQDGSAEQFDHDVAKPYAWKLAHDVRPARSSSGATGCHACHAAGSPLFDGTVTAIGPAPDDSPITQTMCEVAGYDRTKIDAWNASFQGRTAFKWLGFVSAGVVGVILLTYLVSGVSSLFGTIRRR